MAGEERDENQVELEVIVDKVKKKRRSKRIKLEDIEGLDLNQIVRRSSRPRIVVQRLIEEVQEKRMIRESSRGRGGRRSVSSLRGRPRGRPPGRRGRGAGSGGRRGSIPAPSLWRMRVKMEHNSDEDEDGFSLSRDSSRHRRAEYEDLFGIQKRKNLKQERNRDPYAFTESDTELEEREFTVGFQEKRASFLLSGANPSSASVSASSIPFKKRTFSLSSTPRRSERPFDFNEDRTERSVKRQHIEMEQLVGNYKKRVKDLEQEMDKSRDYIQFMATLFEEHLDKLKKKQWVRDTLPANEATLRTLIPQPLLFFQCVVCLKEALYYCCWCSSYCSTECQNSHWKSGHKTACRRNKSLAMP